MEMQFSPDVLKRVQEHMASGQYASEEEFLGVAIDALDAIHARQIQLREEIRSRVAKAGTGESTPLDRDAFKNEARQRLSQSS